MKQTFWAKTVKVLEVFEFITFDFYGLIKQVFMI